MTRERTVLLAALTAQRDDVLRVLDGLSEDDLRRPVLPSGWTCLGMVWHLAVDDERFWFHGIVAGEPVDLAETDGAAWQQAISAMTARDVLDLYRREIERADAIIAATSLDAAPARWPAELWPDWRLDDLREIILHVITETAAHAGHLQAARELIDGRTFS
jgi:uncharacterized damage-inducible protein DinB